MTLPALRCVLTHFYEFRERGERLGSENNKRLAIITSQHKMARRLGLDALRGAVVSGMKGERVLEPALLIIGAALFPSSVPVGLVLRHMVGNSLEFRTAAVFASVYYPEGDLSVEIAERTITGEGDRLLLQAMKEVLDLRGRASTSSPCPRCGEPGTQVQPTLDWLPHRTT
jgi:hypothetical protein